MPHQNKRQAGVGGLVLLPDQLIQQDRQAVDLVLPLELRSAIERGGKLPGVRKGQHKL